MKLTSVRPIVERLRSDTRLWLPALTQRRGFSSSRVEHLLNHLVGAMPENEVYLEVGSLEGRTLEAAACANPNKRIIACDPGTKYDSSIGDGFGENVSFHVEPWEDVYYMLPSKIGCVFYDADHSAEATKKFIQSVGIVLANEAVLVLDDWDRESVREGAYAAMDGDSRWQLLHEMPCYGDGLTCQPLHYSWYFGIAIFGWRK